MLEDKEKLILTLRESMQRGRKIIEKRGISLEQLEELKQNKELHPVEEELLNQLSLQLSQSEVKCAQLEDGYKK